ncbi:MAG TPA: hypothetical protein VGE77_01755 [Nocardioides sp.]
MIEVELRKPVTEYRTVARLRVHDDGTVEFDDPDEQFMTDLHVLVPDDEAPRGMRKIRFEDDPATWARHLDSVHRTGYCVPVVTRDDREPRQ